MRAREREMLTRRGILVCLLVGAMDLVATILGIRAEIAQRKVKKLTLLIFECKQTSHGAFVLGLVAATLLVLAHVIATLLGVCASKSQGVQNNSYSTKVSWLSFVISWILLLAGVGFLGFGVKSHDESKFSCGLSYHRFFAMGAIACFLHGLFCVLHYVSAAISGNKENNDSRA